MVADTSQDRAAPATPLLVLSPGLATATEWLLPILLLWTPFILFLWDRTYPLFSIEVWLVLAAMALVGWCAAWILRKAPRPVAVAVLSGLILLAISLQFESMNTVGKYGLAVTVAGVVIAVSLLDRVIMPLLVVFLGTMLGVTGMMAVAGPIRSAMVGGATPTTGPPAPPRLIHLVLDEHLGVEGMPTDWPAGQKMKDELRSFYERQGFALFGGAYSHYYDTEDSLSNLFNFTAETIDNVLVVNEQYPYRLTRNQYFEVLHDRGYRWHVVGSGYLDLCTESRVVATCREYGIFSLGGLTDVDLALPLKLSLILGAYVSQNHYYQTALWIYESRLQPWLTSRGLPAPALPTDSIWTNRKARFFSANGMAAMDSLTEEILRLRPGDALLAHVLLPHHPYLFQQDCSARVVEEWKSRVDDIAEQARTEDVRRQRYEWYFDQMHCLSRKLEALFDRMRTAGIFEDSIILVHGDHGSRLGLHDPTSGTTAGWAPSDYPDNFSLLYAVKRPGTSGGYDRSVRALETLLAETLELPAEIQTRTREANREPFVYLRPDVKQPLVRVPYRFTPVP